MQTHRDSDYESSPILKELAKKAAEMTAAGESTITAGKPSEKPLAWTEAFGVTVSRLPRDPLCLRISVGEASTDPAVRYLVFRGDPEQCLGLLQRATRALESAIKHGRVDNADPQESGSEG